MSNFADSNHKYDNMNQTVYSTEVLAFVAQATRYCALFDPQQPKKWDAETVQECRHTLTALYGAALGLPRIPVDPFANLEALVTEEEYERVRGVLLAHFGDADVFLDTEIHDMQYSDTPIGISLSELMADLYQCLADAMWVFRQGIESLMEQSIAEIAYTFRHEWGVTVLTVLRQLHRFAEESAEEEVVDDDTEEIW